jgi:hypothetical protein
MSVRKTNDLRANNFCFAADARRRRRLFFHSFMTGPSRPLPASPAPPSCVFVRLFPGREREGLMRAKLIEDSSLG